MTTFEQIKQQAQDSGTTIRTLNATPLFRQLYLVVNETNPGVIYEKETNKIVANAPNKTIEDASVDDLNEFLDDTVTLEYAEDATMIRVYNYQSEWCTATTKCISGEYSYWTNKAFTFDALFKDALGDFDYNLLDPKYTYIFLLKHSLNRIVVAHNENSIVFVSMIENATGIEESNCPDTLKTLVEFPREVMVETLVTYDTTVKND